MPHALSRARWQGVTVRLRQGAFASGGPCHSAVRTATTGKTIAAMAEAFRPRPLVRADGQSYAWGGMSVPGGDAIAYGPHPASS